MPIPVFCICFRTSLCTRLEVSSEIMKVPQEFFVTTIKEVSDKNFGIGGKTIDIVKEEYIKKHQ